MKRSKKIFISLTILFVLAMGLAALIHTTGVLVNRYKGSLVEELSKVTGRPVSIERLEGGLFGSITLHQVEIGPAAKVDGKPLKAEMTVKVERLVVRLSLIDLIFRKATVMESLEGLDFFKPNLSFNLYRDEQEKPEPSTSEKNPQGILAKWQQEDLEALLALVPPLPVRITMHRGNLNVGSWQTRLSSTAQAQGVTVLVKTASYALEDLRGSLDFRDLENLRLRMRARALGLPPGRFKIEGNLKPKERDGEVVVEFASVALKPIHQFALGDGHWLNLAGGSADGRLVLSAAKESPQQWIRGLRVSGNLTVRELEGSMREGRVGVRGLGGSLRIMNRQAGLRGLRFYFAGAPWTGDGKIGDLLQPEINLSIRSEDMPLQRLASMVQVPKSISFTGKASARLSVSGSLLQPKAVAVLQGQQAGAAGFTLNRYEAFLRAEKNGLWLDKLQAVVDGARLRASGTLQLAESADSPRYLTPNAKFEADLRGYPSALLANRFGLTKVAGAVSAKLNFSGPVDALRWKGQISSPQMAFGAETVEKIDGTVTFEDGHLDSRLMLSWRKLGPTSLALEGEARPTRFMFKEISLTRDKTTLASFSGFLEDAQPRKIYLKGGIKNLSLSDLPVANTLGEKVRGKFSAAGLVTGTWAQPKVNFALDGKSLKSVKGDSLAVTAALDYEDRQVKLSDINLRGGELGGQAEWDLRNRDGSANLNLASASLPVLAQMTDLPPAKEGLLDGKVQWVSAGTVVKTTVDLRGRDMVWGDLDVAGASLQGELGQEDWKIKRFSARQAKGGSVLAAGRLNMAGPSKLAEMRLRLQDWIWRGRQLDAEVRVDGASTDGAEKAWWRRLAEGDERKEVDGTMSGTVSIRSLVCNTVKLDDASAQWRWNGKVLEVNEAAWGGIKGSARWPWKAPYGRWVDVNFDKVDGRGAFLLGAALDRRLQNPVSGSFTWKRTGGHRADMDLHDLAGPGKGSVKGHVEVGDALNWKEGSLDLDLVMADAPLEVVKRLWIKAPAALRDLDGTLSGTLKAKGTATDPAFTIVQSVAAPRWSQYRFRRADIKATYDRKVFAMEELTLVDGEERLRLHDLTWKKESGGAWSLNGRVSSHQLPLLKMFRTDSDGMIKASGQSMDEVRAELDFKTLRLNRKDFSGKKVTLRWKDKLLQVDTGDRQAGARARVEIDGNHVRYKDLQAWNGRDGKMDFSGTQELGEMTDLTLHVEKFDSDTVTRLLNWKQDWTGTTWGTVIFRGPRDGIRIVITAKMENGSINTVRYDLLTGTVIAEDGLVKLNPQQSPVWLTREGVYDIQVGGTIPVGDDTKQKELDVTFDMAEGDLSVMEYLDFVTVASGPASAKLRIGGTVQFPEVSGRLESRGGIVKTRGLLKRIEDVQGLLFFDRNKATIHRLDGQVGSRGQRLYVEAAGEENWAFQLEQFALGPLNMKITSSKGGIRFEHTDEFQFLAGVATPNILLSGTWEKPLLSGELRFSDGEVTFPPVKKGWFAKKKDGELSLMDRMTWDFNLELGPKVVYRKENIRVDLGEGNRLKMRGDWDDLGILGNIDVERGNLEYLNQDFEIDNTRRSRSQVRFTGDKDPYLNIWARQEHRGKKIRLEGENFTRTIDVTVWMHAHGKLGEVQMDFEASEDKLTKAQITSLIGFGEDVTATSGSGERAQRAAVRWLLGLIFSKGTDTIEKTGIVDSIEVRAPILENALVPGATPEAGSAVTPGPNPTPYVTYAVPGQSIAEVEVGKDLTDKMRIGAEWTWEEVGNQGDVALESKVKAEYRLGDNTRLKGEYRQDDQLENPEIVGSIEASTSLSNYNPKRRREMLEAKEAEEAAKLRPTPTATAQPAAK